jgi:hypothetical protein
MVEDNTVPKTKACKTCGHEDLEDTYKAIKKYAGSDKLYRSPHCRSCMNKASRKRAIKRHGKNRSPAQKRNRAKKRKVLAQARRDQVRGPIVAKLIIYQSRFRDKSNGLETDLTRSFVEKLISGPCHYCGEMQLKMTLDRIDNDVGHTVLNVLPACIRCNVVRNNIPFKVWELMVPVMRRAREEGLFGHWGRFSVPSETIIQPI